MKKVPIGMTLLFFVAGIFSAHAEPPGWYATPTLSDVKNRPVKGIANTKPIEIKTIRIMPYFKKWKIELIEQERDPLETLANKDTQIIDISFEKEPKSGDIVSKKMSFGGAYFQINNPDSQGTTSWNTDNTWLIQFTSWEREEWKPSMPWRAIAGKASGKIYVGFEGSKHSIRSSYVSGVFKDIPIIYFGKPSF